MPSIGWVAKLFDVPVGTWVQVCAAPNSVRYRTSSTTRSEITHNPFVLVHRWADGTTPAAPADPFAELWEAGRCYADMDPGYARTEAAYDVAELVAEIVTLPAGGTEGGPT